MLKKAAVLAAILLAAFGVLMLTARDATFVVETSTEIDQPPAHIWAVLLDVRNWPGWWPGVESASIDSWQEGGRLILVLKKNPERNPARIITLQQARELAWTRPGVLGSVTLTRWRLLPTVSGTEVRMESRIRGPQAILARFTGRENFDKYQQLVLDSLKSQLAQPDLEGKP